MPDSAEPINTTQAPDVVTPVPTPVEASDQVAENTPANPVDSASTDIAALTPDSSLAGANTSGESVDPATSTSADSAPEPAGQGAGLVLDIGVENGPGPAPLPDQGISGAQTAPSEVVAPVVEPNSETTAPDVATTPEEHQAPEADQNAAQAVGSEAGDQAASETDGDNAAVDAGLRSEAVEAASTESVSSPEPEVAPIAGSTDEAALESARDGLAAEGNSMSAVTTAGEVAPVVEEAASGETAPTETAAAPEPANIPEPVVPVSDQAAEARQAWGGSAADSNLGQDVSPAPVGSSTGAPVVANSQPEHQTFIGSIISRITGRSNSQSSGPKN